MDESKKKKIKYGRNPLPKSEKRNSNKVYKFECTDVEYKQIEKLMSIHYQNFNHNKAYCIRDFIIRSLKNQISHNTNTASNDSNNKITQRFVFEINKIGQNLNQITRSINAKKYQINSATIDKLNASIVEVKNMKSQILNILLDDS